MTPDKNMGPNQIKTIEKMSAIGEKEKEAWAYKDLIEKRGYTVRPIGLRKGEIRTLEKMEEITTDLQKLLEIIKAVHADVGEHTHPGNEEIPRMSELIMGNYPFVPNISVGQNEQIHDNVDSAFSGIASEDAFKGTAKKGYVGNSDEEKAMNVGYEMMLPRYLKIVAEFHKYLMEKAEKM